MRPSGAPPTGWCAAAHSVEGHPASPGCHHEHAVSRARASGCIQRIPARVGGAAAQTWRARGGGPQMGRRRLIFINRIWEYSSVGGRSLLTPANDTTACCARSVHAATCVCMRHWRGFCVAQVGSNGVAAAPPFRPLRPLRPPFRGRACCHRCRACARWARDRAHLNGVPPGCPRPRCRASSLTPPLQVSRRHVRAGGPIVSTALPRRPPRPKGRQGRPASADDRGGGVSSLASMQRLVLQIPIRFQGAQRFRFRFQHRMLARPPCSWANERIG
jgi:hypothetical protein